MIELALAGLNGECRVSVDESGRVRDIAAAVYNELWKDLPEDAFEEKWISTRMVFTAGGHIIHDDLPIVDAIATEELRIHPLLHHAVTFSQLCEARRGEGATEDQLRKHWDTFSPANQASHVELGFVLQVADVDEQIVRRRLSRMRQAQSGRKTKLVPTDKDLSSAPFKRDLMARVAHALIDGRQVSGHHEVFCRMGSLTWTEQDYSWTLLFVQGDFVWRHQRRGQSIIEQDTFPSEDTFLDFWTQLSEKSACVYSGLLLYKDNREAVKLEGTPLIEHFLRLVS